MSSIAVPKPKSMALYFKNFGIGKEKEFFLENLSLMLSSGMPIAAALRAMRRTVKSKRLAEIVTALETDISTGQHFWHSFERTGLFPGYVVSLVRIGEESGRLGENLKLLSRQQAKDRALKDRVRSAMIYPSIVLGLTVTLGIAISWFILPRLASVFLDLRLQVPLLTRVFIGFGVFLQNWGLVAVPAFLAALLFLLWLLFVFRPTKIWGERLLLVLPGVGELLKEVELSRLGYVLGNLLGAGVPMLHAMELLGQASGLANYGRLYNFLRDGMEEGNSFEAGFQAYPKIDALLPVPVQQMIVAGEQSGRLEQIFLAIGQNYEEKSQLTSQNLTVILEPILLVIVWVGVGSLALAVIVPLYSLVGGLDNSAGGEATELPASTIRTPAPKTASSTPLYATSTSFSASTTPAGLVASSTPPALPAVRGASINTAGWQVSVAPGIPFLYARSQPSAAAKIVDKLYARKIYASFTQQDGWYEVTLPDGNTVWANGEYLQIKN
jgi:type II secretory pathway component PulF